VNRPLNYETPRRGELRTRDVVSVAIILLAITAAILLGTYLAADLSGFDSKWM
jgi:hypothetical protein